jgi:hypothetical protein
VNGCDALRSELRYLIAFGSQPTERQRSGDQIDAAMVFERAAFVNMRWLHRLDLRFTSDRLELVRLLFCGSKLRTSLRHLRSKS